MINNIQVKGDNLGIINTGSIQSLDQNITTLGQQGASELAIALKRLADAVLADSSLSDADKRDAVDMLDQLSVEATRPKPQRKPAVARSIAATLGSVLGNAAHLAQIWSAVQPHLEQLWK